MYHFFIHPVILQKFIMYMYWKTEKMPWNVHLFINGWQIKKTCTIHFLKLIILLQKPVWYSKTQLFWMLAFVICCSSAVCHNRDYIFGPNFGLISIYEGVSESYWHHPEVNEPHTSVWNLIHKTSLKSHYAKLHIPLTFYWLFTKIVTWVHDTEIHNGKHISRNGLHTIIHLNILSTPGNVLCVIFIEVRPTKLISTKISDLRPIVSFWFVDCQ